MWFQRKKPKWLVKNTHTLKYAGVKGGWVARTEDAKRFNRFEDARYVSLVLTAATSHTCRATQDP